MHSLQPLRGAASFILFSNLVMTFVTFVFFFFRSPAVLQDTLVLGLLYSEAGQSLLNILGTGVDTVDKLVSLGRYFMYIIFLIKFFYACWFGYMKAIETKEICFA